MSPVSDAGDGISPPPNNAGFARNSLTNPMLISITQSVVRIIMVRSYSLIDKAPVARRPLAPLEVPIADETNRRSQVDGISYSSPISFLIGGSGSAIQCRSEKLCNRCIYLLVSLLCYFISYD